MPKITDTEIEIKIPGGTRGIKGHKGPVGPVGPQGEPGVQGNKGIVGPKGEVGEIPAFSIGTMTIGEEASITTTGTAENNILNMVIPKGEKGDAPDSPEVSFSKTGKKTTMTVEIGETTKTYEMDDGLDPSVSVTKSGHDTTITTNMYDVSKSTVVPDGEHQFTAGEGIDITNRVVSDTNYNFVHGAATTETSGTSMTITNTLNAPIADLELKGDTYQYTTTGKNLLPNERTTITENDITITKNVDGTYKVNGTASADVSLAINVDTFVSMSGTWRMVGCPAGGSASTYMLSAYVGYWGSGSPNIDTGNGTNITYTGNVKVRFYIKSGTQCNNLIFKPMLTTDTSATYNSFEPYTNGASPNPSYPQEVVNATGRQEISVCGKNFANYNLLFGDTSYYTINGDNITVLQADSRAWTTLDGTTWGIFLKAGSYVFSYKANSSGQIQIQGKNSGQLARVVLTTGYVTVNLTQDDIVGCKFLNVSSFPYDAGKVQIEKGNQATTYEAYKGGVYEINLGKNIFNINNYVSSLGGGWSVQDTNNFKWSGTTGSSVGYFNDIYLDIPSGTYTISGNYSNSANLSNMNGIKIRIMNANNTVKSTGYTATFNKENGERFRLLFYKNENNSSGTNTNITETFNNVQLEKCSQATSYSPYRDYSKNLFNDTIRQGVTDYQYGTYSNSNSRLTSTDWITLPAGTYTISGKSTQTSKTFRISNITFDTDGNFYNISEVSGQWKTLPFTFTTPIDIKWKYNLSYSDSSNITPSEVYNMQLEKGSQATSYVPYMSQIELCKIGNYQDFIRKGTGSNLFNSPTNTNNIYVCTCNVGDTFTLSLKGKRLGTDGRFFIRTYNGDFSQSLDSFADQQTVFLETTDGYYTKTITSTTNGFIYLRYAGGYGNYSVREIQVEKGNQATPYEPYGYKDKWYLYKAIGKVVLNGSESWQNHNYGTNSYQLQISGTSKGGNATNLISNYFLGIPYTNRGSGNNTIYNDETNPPYTIIRNTTFASLSDFKTWLSTHNVNIYYVLSTPYTMELYDYDEGQGPDPEVWYQLYLIERYGFLQDGTSNINIASPCLPAYAKIKSFNNNVEGRLGSINKMTELLDLILEE